MKDYVPEELYRLTRIIEENLEWGDRKTWTNKDFQVLSDDIFSHTRKQISVTTLKRLWGRAKLTAKPSMSTLDILAEYAGFESWRAFNKHRNSTENIGDPQAKVMKMLSIAGFLAVSIGLLSSVFFQQRSQKETNMALHPENMEDVVFEFEKVTIGYPNTVIFKYDVGDLPFDSLEIQQSWDTRRRVRLKDAKGLSTTTYYEPGYYSTKLVLNDQVIKQKDLYIPTKGWQAYVNGNMPTIQYLKSDQWSQDKTIRIHEEVLGELNEFFPAYSWLSNLSERPSINSEDFLLETEFRLIETTDKAICKYVWLNIYGSKEVFRFNFSIPGCVGDLMFFLNMEMISGKDHDLSAFGMDPMVWNRIAIQNQDSLLTLKMNDELIFEHKLASDIGQIGGMEWVFEGIGEVRTAKLTDEDEVMDLMLK